MKKVASLFAAALILASPALADEKEMVPSPAFASWSKHKPGTSTVFKFTMSAQGTSFGMENHAELLEVTPEYVVINMWTVTEMGGRREGEKHKMKIEAMSEKRSSELPPGFTGSTEFVGDEEVTIGDKTYNCHVITFTGGMEGAQGTGKIWSSPEVPGGMIRMEMSGSGKEAFDMKGELMEVQEKD